jgi:hypothetical protein
MCVNAAKTELMAVCHDGQPLESVQLSGGEARYVPSFKYLGGVVDTSASWEAEVTARISKTRGRFAEMQRVWGARSLGVKLKMQCFRAYVLPVLLFGSETWALTQKQADRLEVVHSDCLRHILNVRLADRHSKQHLWSQCDTVSLASHLTAHRLRWLGHVLRMGEERYPRQVLFSLMHDAGAAPRGAPPMSWEKCVTRDLQALGQPTNMHDLTDACALRGSWRSMLYRLTHPRANGVPFRRPLNATRYSSRMRQRAETLPFQAAWSATGPGVMSN